MKKLLSALFLVSAGGLAPVRETVNVNIVEVPVSGRLERESGSGADAANFELSDNGTKRAITSFDKIDFASSELMTAISPSIRLRVASSCSCLICRIRHRMRWPAPKRQPVSL